MNNYTCKVTFARAASRKHPPMYMQVLKALVDNPAGLTRGECIMLTHPKGIHRYTRYLADIGRRWGRCWVSYKALISMPGTMGWGCGPYTLLKRHGYATYERKGGRTLWRATKKGEDFWYMMQVSGDLAA